MFKFLLPLIAAIRVPLNPHHPGWSAGETVARAYNGCKLEIKDHAKLQKAIAVRERGEDCRDEKKGFLKID